MKTPANILVVCTHEGIMATILRLIAKNQAWQARGAADMQTATQLIAEDDYDLILLGSGLTDTEEQLISRQCLGKNNIPQIIQHFGGGSGLLFAEIHQAFNSK